jgi:hypothetical protein
MPEIKSGNWISDVPSCSIIVTLNSSDIISTLNFCSSIKIVKTSELELETLSLFSLD